MPADDGLTLDSDDLCTERANTLRRTLSDKGPWPILLVVLLGVLDYCRRGCTQNGPASAIAAANNSNIRRLG